LNGKFDLDFVIFMLVETQENLIFEFIIFDLFLLIKNIFNS